MNPIKLCFKQHQTYINNNIIKFIAVSGFVTEMTVLNIISNRVVSNPFSNYSDKHEIKHAHSLTVHKPKTASDVLKKRCIKHHIKDGIIKLLDLISAVHKHQMYKIYLTSCLY